MSILQNILKNNEKVILFWNTKASINKLFQLLAENGMSDIWGIELAVIIIGVLTSELSSQERVSLIQSLYLSKIQILLATDVAARGVDTIDVKHVIMYDFPQK